MKISIKNILCPVDFSDSSHYALEHAVELARLCHADIEILHVMEPSAYELPEGVEIPSFSSREVETHYRRSITERLEHMAVTVANDGVNISIHLATGLPFVQIVKRATEQSFDMIVMGTHGRSGLLHMLLGSVTEKVIRTAPCPVLTVRHPDHVIAIK